MAQIARDGETAVGTVDLEVSLAQAQLEAMDRPASGRRSVWPWVLVVVGLLVIAGLIGLVISRRRQAKVQDDPATQPSPEPRPQLPPLPDLLDSRPRK